MKRLKNVRELGLAIRDARKSAGMTQADLSDRAHVSRRWLIALENGESQAPDTTKIFDTLRALDLTFGIESAQRKEPRRHNRAAADALSMIDAMGEQS